MKNDQEEVLTTTPLEICPFCQESDFDLIGLKHHLLNYCDDFNATQGIQ